MPANPAKAKQLTNIRSAAADDAIKLKPHKIMSLELAIEWIGDDELVEVTPAAIRLRKRHLKASDRRDRGEKELVVRQRPTSDIRYPTSDIRHPTSDIRHPTSDIRHPTSDIRHPTSDIRHPTSDIRHPTSDIRHPTSDIRRGSLIEGPEGGTKLQEVSEANGHCRPNGLAVRFQPLIMSG